MTTTQKHISSLLFDMYVEHFFVCNACNALATVQILLHHFKDVHNIKDLLYFTKLKQIFIQRCFKVRGMKYTGVIHIKSC